MAIQITDDFAVSCLFNFQFLLFRTWINWKKKERKKINEKFEFEMKENTQTNIFFISQSLNGKSFDVFIVEKCKNWIKGKGFRNLWENAFAYSPKPNKSTTTTNLHGNLAIK